MKKSDSEAEPRSPISFHPMSNGEFEPLPVPVLRQAMDPRPVPAAWDWPSAARKS